MNEDFDADDILRDQDDSVEIELESDDPRIQELDFHGKDTNYHDIEDDLNTTEEDQ